MKIVKQIIATLMILILIGLSGVGIFGLSSTNVDNKKANVALVNEDAGANIQGNEVRYGDDFIKLFVQNKDANYEVTTKVSAQNGINEGKYDLMIVVPKTFTQKAVTYDAAEPERAYLEFAKSNKLSQAEAFKADGVSKVLKETANKTLVQTFTLQVMKTMQGMQEKSLAIIDNETKYQKKYKENIEKPMSDAMSDFDRKLSDISSQQGMVSNFDSYVKGFDSSVKAQTEKEKQNLESFEAQREKAEEITKELSGWSKAYEKTREAMGADTYHTSLADLQKAGALTLQDSIDNLKLNAVRVELYKKRLEEDKGNYENIKKGYNAVAETGVYDPNDASLTPAAKEKLKKVQDTVNGWVGESKSASNYYEKMQTEINGVKSSFETNIKDTCKNLPTNLADYPDLKKDGMGTKIIDFCKQIGAKAEKEKPLPAYSVKYTQIIKVDSQTTAVTPLTNDANAKYLYRFVGAGDKAWKNKFPTENPQNLAIEMEITLSDESVKDSGEITAKQVDLEIEQKDKKSTNSIIVMVPGAIKPEILSEQQETIEKMSKLDTLTTIYYGYDLKQFIDKVNNEKPKPDNIEKLRGLGTEKSLVIKLANLSDGNQLKQEVMKLLAGELSKTTGEYIEQITGYISEVEKISNGALDESKLGEGSSIYADAEHKTLKEPKVEYYLDNRTTEKFEESEKTSLNYVIAIMTAQQKQLTDLSTNLTSFNEKFTTWTEEYNAISTNTKTITDLRDEEGKISISLTDNQKELLTGVADLQKSITSQLEYSQSVMKDSEELKKSSDDSVTKIKANSAKLETTKKEFDKTVDGNSTLVKDFVRKYTSAQSGGADNQLFYQNFSNPVALTERAASNANNLTSFFTILMLSLFALVIARFYNEYRRGFIARKLKSDHGVGNMFAGVTLEISFVAIASVVAAIAVSFIGLQAITDSVNIDKALVYTIVGAALVALAYAFSVILFGFKKYGTQIILAFIALYFLTNGALGLALVKNDSFSWLRAINPLGYMESILQSVFLTQVASVQTLLIVLGVVALVSVVSIYFLQPLMYKQKQSE